MSCLDDCSLEQSPQLLNLKCGELFMNKFEIGSGGPLHDRGIAKAAGSNRVMVAVRATLPGCIPLIALSGVVISTLPTSSAYAETAASSASSNDTLDEVVVTGLRRSVQT